jgi:hypothetical protein
MSYSAKLNKCTLLWGVGSMISRSVKLFSRRPFLGGVLGKMGVFRGIWMDKTWSVASKNVVN